MIYRRWIAVVTTAILTILLAGCFPFGPESPADFDVIATYHDETVNFGVIKTFALPDSIMHLHADGSQGDDPYLSRTFDSIIINQVASNLEALGYKRELDPANNAADVIVTVGVTSDELDLFNHYSFYAYWGWYSGLVPYPNIGAGSNYGYGGVGPGSTQSVRTGTVLIQMVDPTKTTEADDKVLSIWIGLINGLTQDDPLNVRTRLVNSINQCFVQSPYLGSNTIE